LARRHWWIVPIAVLAGLNRETGGLIPVMLLAWAVAVGIGTPEGRRAARIGVVSLAAFAATYGLVRLAVGGAEYVLADGNHPGFEMLDYNVTRGVTWDNLFQTVSVVPLLAAMSFRRWPRELTAFAVAIVPAWMVIHLFTAVLAETRLILVPYTLVLVPAALLALDRVGSGPLPFLSRGR
jgi:hypothetical protein